MRFGFVSSAGGMNCACPHSRNTVRTVVNHDDDDDDRLQTPVHPYAASDIVVIDQINIYLFIILICNCLIEYNI